MLKLCEQTQTSNRIWIATLVTAFTVRDSDRITHSQETWKVKIRIFGTSQLSSVTCNYPSTANTRNKNAQGTIINSTLEGNSIVLLLLCDNHWEWKTPSIPLAGHKVLFYIVNGSIKYKFNGVIKNKSKPNQTTTTVIFLISSTED